MRLFNPGLVLGLAFAASVFLTTNVFAQPVNNDSRAIPVPGAIAAPAPAPAAQPGQDWMTYQNPYVGEQTDISNPNRTTDEILAWTEKTVTDALSFGPDNVNDKIVNAKKSFVQQGWNDFAGYIKQSQMIDMVKNQQYSVATILNGDASVLNSEAAAGSYHWLVEAPLLITFTRKDGDGNAQPAGGGNFKLTIQIGRVSTGGDDGMAIESWKIEAATPPHEARER